MLPANFLDPASFYAQPGANRMSLADHIFLVEQQTADTRMMLRDFSDELSDDIKLMERDPTPGPSQPRPPKPEREDDRLLRLGDLKGKASARVPERTFEECLDDRFMPPHQVSHISRDAPLVVSLRPDQLHMMAAACRYAAQTSLEGGSHLRAIADSVSALANLPERQQPANSYQVELRWQDAAPAYHLYPQNLQRRE